MGCLGGHSLGLVKVPMVLGESCNFSLQHLDQAGVRLAKRVEHINVFQVQRIRAFFATEKHDSHLVVFICDNLGFNETQSCSEHLGNVGLLISAIMRVVLLHGFVAVD